jgi:S-adenosylmethionine synthetase
LNQHIFFIRIGHNFLSSFPSQHREEFLMKRIIVTGGTGLLGRAVYQEFSRTDRVEGWGWQRADGHHKKIDIRNRAEVEAAFDALSPHAVIHCAANRSPDDCEKHPETAEELNIAPTAHLARVAEKYGTKMIYISTDYVFDGTAPPYEEDDRPNPLNIYGESKFRGEQEVAQALSDYVILRVSVLYGPVVRLKESAISVLYEVLKKKEQAFVDDHALRFPTYTPDVARAIRLLMEEDASGIFHFAGIECMTKYEMLQEIADLKGLSSSHVVPGKTAVPARTKRPENSQLDCSKIEKLGFMEWTPFLAGIDMTLKKW